MPTIRELFDATRALARPIEKVITYANRSQEQLKAEISEYVVTDHIERSFEDLLAKMQIAQQGGGGHEIGVWVSGFYGSGKSSFTKYLGFSLDRDMKVGGVPFLGLLRERLHSDATKAMFASVANVYDAVVIFLDLASEMLAGASMEDVSTVLYLKVLKWAGYSEDLKVAELERLLEKDGKLAAFKERAKEELGGIDWTEAHNQPLVANAIAGPLAHEFYPTLFKTPNAFNELNLHVNKQENERVQEMLDLIRRKSGKKTILFIIDEVGQYVSAKEGLILNLDGLAKNLKQLGNGNAWIFATAQQTLTDDNPTAAINSPGLYKLKDRFPIQVHLEASDIKEICHKRLLTKSSAGEKQLSELFDSHGASLRTATQLTGGGVYESELNKSAFFNLYPFLPAHFEILLQLLGRLAKKTGGLGLRSAIKVIQEVLVEPLPGQPPLADAPVGKLATTVTFYDSMHRDIQRSFPHVVEGVERVVQRMPANASAIAVAKSIAILQILENLPVSAANISALMQSDVAALSRRDEVEQALNAMLSDNLIPLDERDGRYRFLTQAAVSLQKKFDEIEFGRRDVNSEINDALREIFKPLPSARLAGGRPVTAGVKLAIGGGQAQSLEGDREPVQIVIEFASPSTYDQVRTDRETDSRGSKEKTTIFLLGRDDPKIKELATTCARCKKFLDEHRSTNDPDIQEFNKTIESRRERSATELARKIGESLLQGSFISDGAHEAVSGRGVDAHAAAQTFLGDAAAKIFSRYSEANLQADSGLAEKFLTTPLDRTTTKEDPLNLVSRTGGTTQIRFDHKAIVSIKDYLDKEGQVEGRRLLDHFANVPFGWSKDTTRYLLAAAFVGGLIKLRIAGQDHNVKSDQAQAVLASNKAIAAIGVALRDERPAPESLLRASQRLGELLGDLVLPLEQEVAVAARKILPEYQAVYGSLAVELGNLGLPQECVSMAEELTNDLREVVSGDGSDAVMRFGGIDSPLHERILWAKKLKRALDNGLRTTLAHIRRLRGDIGELPVTGSPGQLRNVTGANLASIDELLSREAFFEEGAALAEQAGSIDNLILKTVHEMQVQQEEARKNAAEQLAAMPEWHELGIDDREWTVSQLAGLAKTVTPSLAGLRELLNHDYTINHQIRQLESRVRAKAGEHRQARQDAVEAARKAGEDLGPVDEKSLVLPAIIETETQLEGLVKALTEFLNAFRSGQRLRVTWEIQLQEPELQQKTGN
jgi:hypothetical protein